MNSTTQNIPSVFKYIYVGICITLLRVVLSSSLSCTSSCSCTCHSFIYFMPIGNNTWRYSVRLFVVPRSMLSWLSPFDLVTWQTALFRKSRKPSLLSLSFSRSFAQFSLFFTSSSLRETSLNPKPFPWQNSFASLVSRPLAALKPSCGILEHLAHISSHPSGVISCISPSLPH